MQLIKWLWWIGLLFSVQTVSISATKVDLSQRTMPLLADYFAANGMLAGSQSLREIVRMQDSSTMLHVRLQQRYQGYPVWNANMVLHVPRTTAALAAMNLSDLFKQSAATINGVIYQRLAADLKDTPGYVFHKSYANKLLSSVVKSYQQQHPSQKVHDQRSELMVYVDSQQRAHWVYRVALDVSAEKIGSVSDYPVFFIDALSSVVYKHWNNRESLNQSSTQIVAGGGFGGNRRLGRLSYDDYLLPSHRQSLLLSRDSMQQCYFKTKDAMVLDAKVKKVMRYDCQQTDPNHNHVYWNATLGAANGGYSATNDVMYAIQKLQEMYLQWFAISPVIKMENAAPLTVFVHMPEANAYWDGMKQFAYFGDGSSAMHPLTTLDIVAHELSHGFTQQHSNLTYEGESGAMNESFSDMAGMVFNYYVTKQARWDIGAGIIKYKNKPIRWMDYPAKDGHSIEHVKDYHPAIDVHHGSGIYNKVFYLLANSPGWDVRKAFSVMLRANRYYWTSTSNFVEGACGVVNASKDLLFSKREVVQAFAKVGIDAANC